MPIDQPYVLSPFDQIVNVHWGGRIVIAEVPSFLYLNPIDPADALPPSSWSADGKPYGIFDPIPAADYKDAWVWQPFDSSFQVYQLRPFESVEDSGPVPPYHFEPFLAYQTTGAAVISGGQSASDWIATAPSPPDWYQVTHNGPTPSGGPLTHNGFPLLGNTYGEPADYHGIGGVYVYQVTGSLQAWSVGLIVNMSKVKVVAITQSDDQVPNGYLPGHGVNLKCYGSGTDFSITTGGFIRATVPPWPPDLADLVDVLPLWEADIAPLTEQSATIEIARFNSSGVI